MNISMTWHGYHQCIYEGPSKSYVVNGFPFAERRYGSLRLGINIRHYIIHHAHVQFRRFEQTPILLFEFKVASVMSTDLINFKMK